MSFEEIDLSRLPAPKLVEELSAEENFERVKADFIKRAPQFTNALDYEGEPLRKQFQAFAYENTLTLNKVNQGALATLLATASDSDLDNVCASLPVPVIRKIIVEADPTANPPVAEVKESDDEFRRRARLAPFSFSTAGARDSWIYHALSSHADIKDANSVSPTPNVITVAVLSRYGDGAPSQEALDAAQARLLQDDVRPQGDVPTVVAATIAPYTVEANLTISEGPDASIVQALAQAAVEEFTAKQHALGKNVHLSALNARLHQEGVESVDLVNPVADIIGTPATETDLGAAPYATGITINVV